MEPKKDPNINVEKRRNLFLATSFLVSLGIILMALEWRFVEVEKKEPPKLKMNTMDQQMVQPNQPKKPPKKQPKQTEEVDVVEDKEKIEEDLSIGDLSVDENTEFDFEGGEEKVEEEKVWKVVEKEPSFPGGDGKMMKYIQDHINYPDMAKEMDIKGTVYVGFVVEPDGSITNVQVLKGIGGGCDKEAKRVVRNMPKWEPGSQQGRKVRVNVKIPIKFRLQ